MNKQRQEKLIEYVVFIAAGYFLVVNPILKKLGIKKSDDQKLLDDVNSIPPAQNVWAGAAYKFPPNSLLLKSEIANKYVEQIYNAFSFFGDDEATIFGIFRALKTQSQVAWLAKTFKEKYKTDLFTFLQKGTQSSQIWRPITSGLNSQEMATILDIIKSKPKYN
jgi:hypothetical protein